jgi:hypothetical protein
MFHDLLRKKEIRVSIRFCKLLMALALGALLCMPGMSFDSLITDTSSFGPGYQVESFEGVTPAGSNTGSVTYENYFAVGTTGPYTFASGVTLSAPIPASNFESGGPYIHDFAIKATNSPGNQDDFGSNGALSQSTQMPAGFGTAYIAVYRTDNTHFTFTFPADVVRAGFYLTGYPCDSTYQYSLRALDAGGNVLESYAVNSATVTNWATNFVGIQLLSGFRSLDIVGSGQQWTANNAALDMLTFQPLQSTPLPASALLLGTGILGLVVLRWRRKGTA